MKPSGLYRGEFWQAGLSLAKVLPEPACEAVAVAAGRVYGWLNKTRRRVVMNNILPAVDGDVDRAAHLTDALFANFARKLVHLWQFESGAPVQDLISPPDGWEIFRNAHDRGKGVALLTPHLGNWEFGAPLLTARKMNLQVISLEEPHARLGALREQGRARWGVETVFIGKNPFAFIEVIRHLERGGVVALLVDRPPQSAITTQLFGRPFLATSAAAELARATGCALLPVSIVWNDGTYRAQLDPEIEFERARLRQPDERLALTQRIVSHFEPLIHERLDQWYHFVPVWVGQDAMEGTYAPNK